MKTLKYVIPFFFLFTSCEDVIELDLESEEPRLVIEASINWLKGTTGNDQIVKLSLTTPYYSNEITPANNAIVTISDENNNTFIFTEEGTTGVYKTNQFIPVNDERYYLFIQYGNETYTAEETLISVSDLDFIQQDEGAGILGDDIELKAYFSDPETEGNHYLFEFQSEIFTIPDLNVYNDEFTNGNQMFGYYSDEDLESGQNVTIKNYGISEGFYNYMFILLQQNSQDAGGPFETQPATVRGNCINQTNPNNFPLGYFRLSEVAEIVYTIE
ncbi:MAG: DUF4249 domain-containing protein [Flavobacteriaceae bacterium]|nr:DUF4249 domain-containing protein [Bacteroidia bacterium]NNK83661.1 DUF4249 domain-containing protein [Flavobacteriaceae bacterium]